MSRAGVFGSASMAFFFYWAVGGSAWASQLRRSEAEICLSKTWVFIGIVDQQDSFFAEPGFRDTIKTRVSIRVEAFVHGDPPPRVSYTLWGGRVGGVESFVVSDGPIPEVGSRYLFMGALRAPNPRSGSRDYLSLDRISAFSPVFTRVEHFHLDSGVPLPSDDVLQQIWYEHCDPARVVPRGSRPSEPWMALLPGSLRGRLLDVCEHY